MGNTEGEKKLEEAIHELREETMQKLYRSEAGVRNLISGMVAIFVAIAIIIWMYSYISGMASTGDTVLKPRPTSDLFAVVTLCVLLISVFGGFEIGMYVQSEFHRRRKPPPPPPSLT